MVPQIEAIYVSFPKKVFSSSFKVIKGQKVDNEVNNFHGYKKYYHQVHFRSFFKISIYALEGSKILIFSNHIGVEGLVFRHQNRTSVRWRRDDEILERLATLQPRNLAPSTNTYQRKLIP